MSKSMPLANPCASDTKALIMIPLPSLFGLSTPWPPAVHAFLLKIHWWITASSCPIITTGRSSVGRRVGSQWILRRRAAPASQSINQRSDICRSWFGLTAPLTFMPGSRRESPTQLSSPFSKERRMASPLSVSSAIRRASRPIWLND